MRDDSMWGKILIKFTAIAVATLIVIGLLKFIGTFK